MAVDGVKYAPGTYDSKNPTNPIEDIGTADFLKLMISELQNQDPLNPADNTALLTQISQIRQVSASDKLTTTLDSVLLGQNLTSATSMIGKTVTALGDDNKDVTGVIDKVTVAGGDVKIHIGDKSISLKNIREVVTPTTT
ncbi:MAG: flagellar hook capping FlgD N-terminal domain-containing protein [Pirellulales bacterium]